MQLGTMSWAARRDGRLTFGEKLRVVAQGIAATLRTRRGEELGAGEARLAEALRAPSGELARWAEQLCAATSPPFLINHCLRSYAYGSLLAARDGVAVDSELLWLAALLHDLGLTSAHRAPDATCFAFHGGVVARRLLAERGVPAERAERVAEAICQHLSVKPIEAAAPEARYLADATALDTVGMRFRDLGRPAIDAVDAAYPRLAMKNEFAATIASRSREERGTRLALLCRLGFLGRVRRAPFAD
jgi:hypothetical protein